MRSPSDSVTVGLIPTLHDACWFVEAVLAHHAVMPGLPPAQRCFEWRHDLVLRSARNEAWLVGARGQDGSPAGLFIGTPCDGALFVHQAVVPAWRTHSAVIAGLAARLAFEAFPHVRHLVGLTPVSNRASIFTALRAGFVKCGVWPRWWHGDGGACEDCVCLVLERGVLYGQRL